MIVSPVNYMYVASGSYDGTIIPKTATNTNIVTTTVTGTNTRSTGNLITVSSTANFVVGYPVAFSGVVSNVFATTTYGTGNVITVTSTTGMIVGGRIIFSGSVFGGISSGTYYITNVYPGNSNITISTTFSGSNVALTAGTTTGNCNVSYNGIMGGLTSTDYFVQSIDSGTTFTVSTSQGGAPVALLSENGSMSVTTATDYTVTLNSTTSIANNDPIMFSGTAFGGIVSDQIYYVANIIDGTTLAISKTRANGIAGQEMALTTASGTMVIAVYEGTSIWKRTQLNNW
jgi:hypothetical protein